VRALTLLLSAAFAATALAQSSPTPAEEPLPAGNASAGAVIFSGKGACQTCHRVSDTGSRLGPDLTDIGALRTAEQLQTSLIDPNAEVLPEGRFYRVVTRDGVTITGRLLNLDNFQVLMMDPKEQLRSFTRSELREQGFVKGSAMPSFRQTLSRQELADVIAYLGTLKGVVPQ
jgi:putative heme-binding domain-containing protein